MKESKLIKGVITTIALAAFSIPAIAAADAEIKGKSEKVSFSDLNVSKREGAQQLYSRLQQAAKRVCGVEPLRVSRSVGELSKSMRCYRQTLDASVAKIDSEELAEIHAG